MNLHRYFLLLFIILLNSIVSNFKGQNLLINEFLASKVTAELDPDNNLYSDWIEIYNNACTDIDISGYFLSDNFDNPTKWKIPEGNSIQQGEYFIFCADGRDENNHANFKLDKIGEVIALYSPDTLVVDSIIFSTQQNDISYGRLPDELNKWSFFNPPSLGLTNNPDNSVGITPNPIYSVTGGFYSATQTLNFLN